MAHDLRYLDVAERVLSKHRRPLRSRDLISLAIEDGLVESWDSNTPQKSMQARLSLDILNRGVKSRFIRTERGRFYLRELLTAPLSKHKDLFSTTEESPNYARPFTTRRRTFPTPFENVLTIPRKHYQKFLTFQGLRVLDSAQVRELISPDSVSYVPRIRAETLDDRKQVLTYVLVTYRRKVLSFRRGSYNNIAAFLRGSRCIGFGGHVTEHDHTLFSHDDLGVTSSALRELAEELSTGDILHRMARDEISDAKLIYRGVLNDDSSEVGRRHVAIVFEYQVRHWNLWSKPQRGEASINQLEWINTKTDKIDLNEFEYWSQLCWRGFFPPIIDAQPSYRILRKRPFRGPHLLVIAGTIGSGKSAATEFFSEWLRYVEINSGRVLSRILKLPSIPRTSRGKFQAAAFNFINSKGGPRRLAREICKIADSVESTRVVVDGIRHRETLKFLREYSGRDVAVVYVQAAPDIAYKLYSSREHQSISPEKFFELYSAPVESDVRYLIQDADVIIYNWTGKDEYDAALDKLGTELGLYDRRKKRRL
jgi:predicted NUDIX family phosphoesterase